MTDAVFSAEYAASLVQRARDGATWHEGDFGWFPSLHLSGCLFAERYDARREHWVAWYRETCAAAELCAAPAPYAEAWPNKGATMQLDLLLEDFYVNVGALGSLCQLPAEWTDAHRDAAREMRTR